MNEHEPKIDLETRILNRILAQLYLNSTVPSPRTRSEEQSGQGIERPSALEMRQTIEDLDQADRDLGSEMRSRIIEELVTLDPDFRSEGRARIKEQFNAALDSEEISDEERQRLLDSIVNDVLALGPLEPLLADGTVTELLVDGPNKVYVERHGKFVDTPARFRDDEHLMRIIRRILTPLGRRVDEASPIVDARLSDFSRVNVVIPPLSLVGPVMTIRKFSKTPLTFEDLLRFGSVNEDILKFLMICVRARLNMVIAGGTGSGKTTLLNLITGLIPDDERVVTVEEQAELQPRGIEHLVRLESRPPDWEGKGEITMRDLVINALRMRPDRIIVSEVRAAEALDLLRAMNTGHDGCLINIHATSPLDVLARLETMVMMANPALPLPGVRQEIASAIDLIVYQERMQDGSRKIVKVTEVDGVQGDVIMLQDVFEFRETGLREGKVTGYHTATGAIPKFFQRIAEAGIELPMSLFVPK